MIGNRIKELRQRLSITQQEFADNIGIKRNTVAQYEIGRNEPQDAVISLICNTYNVNRHWLKSGEGEMFNNLDREREIATFFAKVAKQPNDELDEFKRNLVSILAKLDEGAWEVLRQIAEDLATQNDKKKEG
ncbi:MAG: helix-turn-helix transcriptional regulator [Alistipes sp.]|nr:helix-turn-helix transcriptional regulator [Alistipes sp.]